MELGQTLQRVFSVSFTRVQSPLVSIFFQPSSNLLLSNTANLHPNIAIRAPESLCWAYREIYWTFKGDLFLKVVELLWQRI